MWILLSGTKTGDMKKQSGIIKEAHAVNSQEESSNKYLRIASLEGQGHPSMTGQGDLAHLRPPCLRTSMNWTMANASWSVIITVQDSPWVTDFSGIEQSSIDLSCHPTLDPWLFLANPKPERRLDRKLLLWLLSSFLLELFKLRTRDQCVSKSGT